MGTSTAVRLAALLAVAIAIGASWRDSGTAYADGSVTVAGFVFSPPSVSINAGESVTWTNTDSAPHSVAFSGGPVGSTMGQGQSYTRTFDAAGTFSYICGIHGSSMSGSVTVAASQAPTATPTPTPTAGPPTVTPTQTTVPPTPTTAAATATSTVTPTPTPTPASRGDDDPTATGTPDGSATDTPTAASSTGTPSNETVTPVPTGTPGNGDEGDAEDDGGSNAALLVGVAIAVLAGVVLAGMGVVMRRR